MDPDPSINKQKKWRNILISIVLLLLCDCLSLTNDVTVHLGRSLTKRAGSGAESTSGSVKLRYGSGTLIVGRNYQVTSVTSGSGVFKKIRFCLQQSRYLSNHTISWPTEKLCGWCTMYNIRTVPTWCLSGNVLLLPLETNKRAVGVCIFMVDREVGEFMFGTDI
jgi:hypothetical protein